MRSLAGLTSAAFVLACGAKDHPPGAGRGPDDSFGIANEGTHLEVRGPKPRPAARVDSWTGGRWYCLALTYDTSTYVFYIDGVQIGQGEASHAISSDSSQVTFGSLPERPPDGDDLATLEGDLDEIALYDRALTADEVQYVCTLPDLF
jgi:hypothetical protein